MDENGNVPCQSKDQCPADFTRTTSVVTYSCEKGLCQENVEEGENILEYVKEDPLTRFLSDTGIAGGKEVTHAALNAGTSFLSIGNPNRFVARVHESLVEIFQFQRWCMSSFSMQEVRKMRLISYCWTWWEEVWVSS